MFSAKRKNEDKRKNQPHRRRLAVLMLISGMFLIGVAIYALHASPNQDFPSAPLVYMHHPHERMAINLQTGERFPTNSSDTGGYGDSTLLPDGKWRVSGWYFEDADSHEAESALALRSVENPDLFLDTGRLAFGATWSSDSQWIAFLSRRANCFPESKAGLLLSLRATPHPKADYCTDYPSYAGLQKYEVWLFNIQTGESFPITDNDVTEKAILFSPRQAQLIYITDNVLSLYDVGTGQTRPLFAGATIYSARWSPDARWIAFTAGLDESLGDLYITRIDGRGLQKVAQNIRPYEFHWAP